MPEIFSTINYEYKKPLNFDGAISEFDIFKNLAVEACEKPEIKIVNNVKKFDETLLDQLENQVQ